MQLQSIFILIHLFFCVHDHIHAVPVQQTKLSRNEKNNNTRGIELPSDAQACLYSKDCPPHSQCVSGECQCVRGWTTWKDGVPCSYEQKSKLAAFVLSFLLGNFGADWFYLSQGNAVYILAGVFKLLMACGCCCSLFRTCGDKDDGFSACCGCISGLLSFGGGIWWLVDWIRILVDAFPDGNGAPLYNW